VRPPGATVGGVSEGADQGGWRRALGSRLIRLQQQDGGLGQLAGLWVTVIAVVLTACAAFFLAIYWIFG